MLELDPDLRPAARRERDRGRDAVSLKRDAVPETLRVLEYAVQPKRHGARQRLIDVRGQAPVTVRAGLERHVTGPHEPGLLRHAVDHASAAAATEHHPVGPLERLDALDVVKVAIVLDVIANAVDIEGGRRAVAAD